ncbi:MAG: glycoside hydrolase family 18 protein [Fibrobacter sp.]|nr:glycoside hydrolase family 18 protein [Fibrobacter sp.]
MKLATFFRTLFLGLLALFSAIYAQGNAPSTEKKILAGYYPDWGKWNKPSYTVEMIPYGKLTHVLWSFISPKADGSLRGDAVTDPRSLDEMVKLAHAAGTRAIISLGGAGLCQYFAPVAKDDALRSKFVAELMSFVSDHNLDGVDMDWEFSKVPVPDADTAAYNKLLGDIRAALPPGKTLSAALPCSGYYGKYFTADALVENLDWFGFMTYDITGEWDDKARFDSPLHPNTGNDWTTWSWDQTANYWESRGVPTEKMVFGVPSFGFVFSGTAGPGTTFDKNSGKNTAYAEIMKMAQWEFHYDEISQEPYAVSGDLFATYENEKSATAKAEWIKANMYAGAMIWELSQDYTEGEVQPIVETLSATLQIHNETDGISERRIAPRTKELGALRYNYNALGQVRKPREAPGRYFTKNR